MKDLIIVGGGPAGLMAANQASGKLDYLLLEKNEQVGKKLRLTGGKRCNITNDLPIPSFIESLHVKHKKFLFKALSHFGNQDILTFFKERGLNLVKEGDIKYFPETGKSKDVIDVLLKDIDSHRIIYNQSLKRIQKMDGYYQLETKDSVYKAKHVILATGSNAYPSTGSSGDILDFASSLDIKTKPFTPAETSIYIKEMDLIADFQGISLETNLSIIGDKKQYQGSILFTHFGLSGPLILHLSELIYEKLQLKEVKISFSLTKENVLEKISEANPKQPIIDLISELTQKRIAKKLVETLGIQSKTIHMLSKKDIHNIDLYLNQFTLTVLRTESKEKAFVNAGGIEISEVDPNTMAIKSYDGLYVVGEALDLQGPIGGFNITIAFSTASLAVLSIINLKGE